MLSITILKPAHSFEMLPWLFGELVAIGRHGVVICSLWLSNGVDMPCDVSPGSVVTDV